MQVVDTSATLVPIVITDGLLGSLLPRARAAVLAALVMGPESELHIREIARRTGFHPTGVLRELRLLERLGIAVSRSRGGQKLFRINPDSPIQPELSLLIRKTAGLADVVRTALQPLQKDIELAYIYGSQAAGTAGPASDVDVMVVGRSTSVDVYDAMERCSQTIGRPVNPTLFAADDYWQKVRLGRGFPFTAHNGPKILLLGGEREPA